MRSNDSCHDRCVYISTQDIDLRPIYPGEILREDYLAPLNLQQAYDLKITEAEVAKLIAKEIRPIEHA